MLASDRSGPIVRTAYVLVLIALIVVIARFLWPSAPAPQSPSDSVSQSPSDRLDRPAPEAVAPSVGDVPVATAEIPVGEARRVLRIHGSVSASDGTAIGDAVLHWLPMLKMETRAFANDAAVLSAQAPPASLPDAFARQKFERGVTTRSDASGHYELSVPRPSGTSLLFAVAEGFEVGDEVIGSIPEADDSAEREIDFGLQPATSIRGHVSDRATGAPTVGVRVVAAEFERGRATMFQIIGDREPSALVDDDGAYRIVGLPAGDYRVVPRTGYSDYQPGLTRDARRVVIDSLTPIVDVDLVVDLGGVVSGRVVDGSGEPIGFVDYEYSASLKPHRLPPRSVRRCR